MTSLFFRNPWFAFIQHVSSKHFITEKLKVMVLLVQEGIYTTNLGSKEEARKKERLVMSEAIDKEDAETGECQHYDLELPIDEKMALTDYPW